MSRSAVRRGIVLVGAVGVFVAAFVAGRATGGHRSWRDSIRLDAGVPVGVLHTPAGALAAADNYVSAGITDSLDQRALRTFADTLVAPAKRRSLLTASQRLAQSGPPHGTRAVGLVVAHALRRYAGDRARVTTWQVGSYWGPGLQPSQYWALADLSLRWADGRWQIASLDERLPGPVPPRIAAPPAARKVSVWNRALAGMSAPYYGAG